MIYSIDFDGTIVTHMFPAIGSPIEETVAFIKSVQEHPFDRWILTSPFKERSL